MKRALLIIILLFLLVPLCGCTLFPSKARGVERLLVVQAMGVDTVGDRVELSLLSSADSARGEGPVRLHGSGVTISDAAEDILSRANEEELFCAHTGYVLVGEESAQALGAVLRYVCRSREIRMDVPLYLVRGESAETALLRTGEERVGAVELLDALSAAAPQRSGETPPSVSRIAAELNERGCALLAALACEPSSEGSEGETPLTLAPAGYAVISDGGLLGFLEQEDVAALDLLRESRGVHAFTVTDREGRRVTLQTAPGQSRKSLLRGEDGAPRSLELAISLSASIAELDGMQVADDAAYADELGALLEREILLRAGRLVQLQKRFGADFLGCGELPLRLAVSVRISHSNDLREGT